MDGGVLSLLMLAGALQLKRSIGSGWSKLGREKARRERDKVRGAESQAGEHRQPGDLWCVRDVGIGLWLNMWTISVIIFWISAVLVGAWSYLFPIAWNTVV